MNAIMRDAVLWEAIENLERRVDSLLTELKAAEAENARLRDVMCDDGR